MKLQEKVECYWCMRCTSSFKWFRFNGVYNQWTRAICKECYTNLDSLGWIKATGKLIELTRQEIIVTKVMEE